DIFKGFENKGNIIVLQLFMQQWFIGQRSYGCYFFASFIFITYHYTFLSGCYHLLCQTLRHGMLPL
ncbi:hypothetical protein, partial [Prevotella nigrescens]|uniref:hypothetical protein n=1 Tax=Prevotella nigrescens TaxID=28133 RepID=UPI00288062E5